MEQKPKKPGIKRKDLEGLLLNVEALVYQNVAMRRAGELRSIRQTWRDRYARLLPEIRETYSSAFQPLHYILRDRDLPTFFRMLREVVDRLEVDGLLNLDDDSDEKGVSGH